jgi:transposase-like protein
MGAARVASSLGVPRARVWDWVRRAEEAALPGTPAATRIASMAEHRAWRHRTPEKSGRPGEIG